jgi:quinol monooxygenase YgiN
VEIFLFVRLHARPGKNGELRQAMFDVQGPTRQEPGCLSYGVFRSVRDTDEFYIHTRWKDMAAFERHAALPHTVRFVEVIEPLLDHPFKVTVGAALVTDTLALRPVRLTGRSTPTRTRGVSRLAGRRIPWFVRPRAGNIRCQHSQYSWV